MSFKKRRLIFMLGVVLCFFAPFMVTDNSIDLRTSVEEPLDPRPVEGDVIYTQAIRLDRETLDLSSRLCVSPMILVPPGGSDGEVLVRLSSGSETLLEKRVKGSSQKRNGFIQLCLDQKPVAGLVMRVKDIDPKPNKPFSIRLSRDVSFGKLAGEKGNAAMQLRIQYWIKPFHAFYGAWSAVSVAIAVLGFALFMSFGFTRQHKDS
ncbi:hypothetical protein QBK99_16920 [Corticibacterium sp. UT-5YL-CI-8]|nr:hypothetical protein [Tianweitania sp. UT-5YL-CI-8]